MKTPAVRITDLGAWTARPLLAEYDPSSDTISVNARVVAALERREGIEFARRFVAFAVAHEHHHRQTGSRDEPSAHTFAQACCGENAAIFECALRTAGLA